MTRAVLEAVGWDRFAVWDGSGGAPHALAIAASLPDRVTACASVVGLAPYDAAGLDWYAKAGGIQVAGDYQLPEGDRRALAVRPEEDGYLERMSQTYRHGVDGWVEDCIALTRPWGFEFSELTMPASVWYGAADVLVSRDHHDFLLSTIPGARRQELRGSHVLDGQELAAIYAWLARASR
jgi:pimeloyl-ACP methyl ester carboxylesterase